MDEDDIDSSNFNAGCCVLTVVDFVWQVTYLLSHSLLRYTLPDVSQDSDLPGLGIVRRTCTLLQVSDINVLILRRLGLLQCTTLVRVRIIQRWVDIDDCCSRDKWYVILTPFITNSDVVPRSRDLQE